MKKNLYFRQVLRRENVLKNIIFEGFLKGCSYFRCLTECFIRKNFGQRYYSLASNITVAIILFLFPILLHSLDTLPFFDVHYDSVDDYNAAHSYGLSFWLHYGSWYLLLAAFLYKTWERHREVRYKPGVFDFARFSLYQGDIDERFFKLHPLGHRPSIRTVEVYYEPALFFLVGLVLSVLGQKVGGLLMVSSIFYSISYAAAYKRGDDFIMDKIDEIILNEETEEALVNEVINHKRGVRFSMKKPDDRNLRRKIAATFIENDEEEEITFAE